MKYPDALSFRLRRTDAVNELFVFTEKMRRESADNQKLLLDWHASYRDSIQRSYDVNALYRWLAHAVKDCVGETDVKFFRTKEEGGGIAWNRLDGVLTENSGRKAQLDALRLVYAAFWI